MMILSRVWYVILSLFLAFALYIVFLAVGQYDRRNAVAMAETLASDSQVVGWALQIDARQRLDGLVIGALDKGVQDALVAASDKDRIPSPAKEGARKALTAINEKLPAELKCDALFAVDREGRVVAHLGFDEANAFEDFELGGYAAVNDALHGYLRDDTWVLGGKVYRVVARPVEFDVTQRPAGAIVGVRLIDAKFAQELSRRTRTNLAFYSAGQRVASAGTQGFEENQFDQVVSEIAKLEADKEFRDKGRSDVRMVSPTLGAVYARVVGEAWDMNAGFVVVRPKVTIGGPLGFLTGADDKDKTNVNVPLLVGIGLFGIIIGILFSVFEHTVPLRQFGAVTETFKKGPIDSLPLAQFRGAYRTFAANINGGVERLAEKGGAPRKAADLESILGPVPAQPAMSAFSFPLEAGGTPGPAPVTPAPPPTALVHAPTPPGPQVPNALFGPHNPGPNPQASRPTPVAPPPVLPVAPPPVPKPPPPARMAPPLPPQRPAPMPPPEEEDEEATMVAAIPAEVMAQATGEHRNADEIAEWQGVFEDFVRTKQQCREPTEGLTFEKFLTTLRKNRDALILKHGCKRVKFSVYVKEGRASLKATPVKE